ncbi:MAG: transglycosylase domain-containing protein, partial [Anaerolineales bacterium]|nr:transglycosylase domain-containing protein [Anaerolineales bacterium]
EQILEWYLNSEYYGNLAYGVDAAARVYFGKSASELNHAEAATLAAAAISPNLNPIDAPAASEEAKVRILYEMFEQGFMTADQLETSLEQELVFRSSRDFPVNIEPAFTNLVIDQASQFISEERIYRGGLEIITSLDYELQTQVECTVEHQINRITGGDFDGITGLDFDECEMARLLPSNYEASAGQDFTINADVLVMDPQAGQILAMVGNSNGRQEQDIFSGHPPGSILSPFIYLTSFTRGTSPATLLWDIPANIPSGLTDIQRGIEQFHGPVSLRTALANDYLVPGLQILTQMDPEQVWQTAERLGLTRLQIPPGDGTYRILFQGGETDLAELSQAYGVLANQGVLAGITQSNSTPGDSNSPIRPQVVLKVLDDSGFEQLDCTDPITECHIIKRPVISKELAYLVTDVLSDETARWPSLGHPNSLEIGRPAAAKIGSTHSREDIWTIGYTPDLLAGVWIGSEETSLDNSLAPEWAAGMWHAVLQYTSKD